MKNRFLKLSVLMTVLCTFLLCGCELLFMPYEVEYEGSDVYYEEIPETYEVTTEEIVVTEEVTTPEETTTTEEEREYVEYSFRSEKQYVSHYEKHGHEFGDITIEEYLHMANDLINSDSDTLHTKISKDGDYLFYDEATNEFLVLSDDGYIRTFFKPNAGIDYYNRQ
ncbi:MAG: hypothetical protein IKK32_00900 [Oscillospiraceae bacterium]|nr:hypothetical protein [Oscillospiraceae bacterium]